MFKRLLRMSNAAILIDTLGPVERKTVNTQSNRVEKVVIIGSGPAGHTAAIYSINYTFLFIIHIYISNKMNQFDFFSRCKS